MISILNVTKEDSFEKRDTPRWEKAWLISKSSRHHQFLGPQQNSAQRHEAHQRLRKALRVFKSVFGPKPMIRLMEEILHHLTCMKPCK